MKKLILIMCLLLFGAGCQEDAWSLKDAFIVGGALKVPIKDVVWHRIEGNLAIYGYKGEPLADNDTSNVLSVAKGRGLAEIKAMRKSGQRVFQVDDGTLIYEFIPGPAFYKDANGNWFNMEHATTTAEIFAYATRDSFWDKIIGAAHATNYSPDGSSYEDGRFEHPPNTNWDTVHDDTQSLGGASDEAITATAAAAKDGSGGNFAITRSGFCADTSSIDDGATITDGSVQVYVSATGETDSDAQSYIQLVDFSPADVGNFADGDYDQFGATDNPTPFSDDKPDISANITTSAYNTWDLNVAGIANVNKTGASCFGFREGHDVEDDPIANGNYSNYMNWEQVENEGSNNPILVVNVAVAGGAEVDTKLFDAVVNEEAMMQ